jgi:hypothetical protein
MGKQSEADWDKDFYAMIQDVKNRSVEVSLTLTSKKFMRNWLCEVPDPELEGLSKIEARGIILAEGHGSIQMPNGRVSFLWRLPFRPWASPVLAQDLLRGEPNSIWDELDEEGVPVVSYLMDESDFDFLGHDSEVPEAVRQSLLDKLSKCEYPSSMMEGGLPTLQDPVSLLECFIRVYDMLDAAKRQKQGNKEPSTFPPPDTGFDSIRDFLSVWLSTHSPEEAAGFIDMITEGWNIGHTVRTRVVLESEPVEED